MATRAGLRFLVGSAPRTRVLSRSSDRLAPWRRWCTTATNKENQQQGGEGAPKQKTKGDIGQFLHPSSFDKWCLVRTQMYEKAEDIPTEIRFSTMSKAHDLMRIQVSVVFLAFAGFSLAYLILTGRRNRRQGLDIETKTKLKDLTLKRKKIVDEANRLRAKLAERESYNVEAIVKKA